MKIQKKNFGGGRWGLGSGGGSGWGGSGRMGTEK